MDVELSEEHIQALRQSAGQFGYRTIQLMGPGKLLSDLGLAKYRPSVMGGLVATLIITKKGRKLLAKIDKQRKAEEENSDD